VFLLLRRLSMSVLKLSEQPLKRRDCRLKLKESEKRLSD